MIGRIWIRSGCNAISSRVGSVLGVVHRRPLEMAHQPKGDEGWYQRLSSFWPEKLPSTPIHGFDDNLVVPPQYRGEGTPIKQFDAAITQNRAAKRPRIDSALCSTRGQPRGCLEHDRGGADAKIPNVELQSADRDHGMDAQSFQRSKNSD